MANLKGNRVLVTGGAGIIGSHIVDLLTEEDCREIVALDNMVRGREPRTGDDARARSSDRRRYPRPKSDSVVGRGRRYRFSPGGTTDHPLRGEASPCDAGHGA